MEELLHYCWKHKIFPLSELKTTEGESVEVLNPGIQNKDAGPDFLDAKLKIGNVVWVGNVELHVRTSDWYRHHHEEDARYDNIILHGACKIDKQLAYKNGKNIPQIQLNIPEYISRNYENLQQSDVMPMCRKTIGNLKNLYIHSWMSALQVERMQMRTRQIMERREMLNKNWEDTLFVTLARSFGFGKNGDAFEHWAHAIPMMAAGKHRDNLMQIEAIFFGQAGLLESDKCCDEYYVRLKKEYTYLKQKFSLSPISADKWKFLRLRPQNFPHIRIAQLAMLYYEQRISLSDVLNAKDVKSIMSLLETHVSDYWTNHYTFGKASAQVSQKSLTEASKTLLVINAISPIVFSYGRYKGDDVMASKGITLLEELKPENNYIIRDWADAGLRCENAADSQALIHLHNKYCIRRDCLRCRFGYEYISHTPDFMSEEKDD